MLETGNLPSDDIAAALIYQDPTYFRRLPKKRTGVTSGRYRQKLGG